MPAEDEIAALQGSPARPTAARAPAPKPDTGDFNPIRPKLAPPAASSRPADQPSIIQSFAHQKARQKSTAKPKPRRKRRASSDDEDDPDDHGSDLEDFIVDGLPAFSCIFIFKSRR